MTSLFTGLDYYKLTMSQLAHQVAPEAEVTFTLKNRGNNSLLKRVSVLDLTAELGRFQYFSPLDVFSLMNRTFPEGKKVFNYYFTNDLLYEHLPRPVVEERNGDLHVEVTGPWFMVTFWETIIMSSINDLYFSSEPHRKFTLGHSILSQKIEVLRAYPDIKFTDFGTRRRFGLGWQERVISRLVDELPGQFMGTSNPYFADKFGIPVVGTFAHELPMVYAALAQEAGSDPLDGHSDMLDDWYALYGPDLSIALTDTFGTDFFWSTFGERRANEWAGLRHDSGDPFEFGEQAIKFYQSYGIDPRTKRIVFSDGLDLNKIIALHDRFAGRIEHVFGWGTGLTNDVGVKPNNIVMKATAVNGIGTVKLSDDEGKHTGDPRNVEYYQNLKKKYLKS